MCYDRRRAEACVDESARHHGSDKISVLISLKFEIRNILGGFIPIIIVSWA